MVWAALASAFAPAAAKALTGGGGGGGGGAPSRLDSRSDLSTSSVFDSSGWIVNTGGSKSVGASALPEWALPALAGGVLLWMLLKKRKK